MSVGALLGSVQYPVLNQDPGPPAIPGGGTLLALDKVAPQQGTVYASIACDVAVTATLTAGSNHDTVSGTALMLSVEVLANQRVTLSLVANSGPVHVLSAALTFTPASVVSGDLIVLGNLTVEGSSSGLPTNPVVDTLAIVYTGAGSDPVFTEKESTDTFPRFDMLADARWAFANPNAPANFGTHNAGAIGAGSDYQWGWESLHDTAWMHYATFPRLHLTDGTHYLVVNTAETYPLAGSPNVGVSSTAGLAASGTLNAYSAVLGNGTLTYTSIVDGTTLGGCSSTGLTTSADTSQRYAYWLTDALGAPIWFVANFGGMYLTDNYNFRANGVFTDNTWDILVGFDQASHTGTPKSSIKLGSDNNVKLYRGNDGLGNNQVIVSADGHILTWYASGLVPGSAINMGTALATWGIGYFNRLQLSAGTAGGPSITSKGDATSGLYFSAAGEIDVAVAGALLASFTSSGVTFADNGTGAGVVTDSAVQFGADGKSYVARYNDGLGNSGVQINGNGALLRWYSTVGLYPSSALPLGTTANPWGTVNAASIQATTATPAAGVTPAQNDNTTKLATTAYVQTALSSQVYNQQTANFTNQPAGTGTFAAADATSGTAPSIVLPNDGHTYMVTWDATYWKAGTLNDVCWAGIGVDATHVVAAKQMFVNNVAGVFAPVTAQIVGSGQTIKCFTANNSGNGASHVITVGAGAGPGSVTPSFLSAVRVA